MLDEKLKNLKKQEVKSYIRLIMRRLVILYVEKCPVQTLNNIKKPDENIIKLTCAQYD